MAALPVTVVRVLADAHTIARTDTPHCVILRGVEAVRDAMPMLAVLTNKLLKLKGGVESGTAADREDGTPAATTTTPPATTRARSGTLPLARAAATTRGPSATTEDWFFGNMQPLQHAAVLLEELLDDIIPWLERSLGGRDNLRRLRDNGKEIRKGCKG